MNTTAKIFSYLFHPVLIPIYAFAFLAYSGIFSLGIITLLNNIVISVLAVVTVIIPIIFLFILKRQKTIQSFQMKNREERIYPLLLMFLLYTSLYLLSKKYPILALSSYVLLISTTITFTGFILTLFWKVSLHGLGMGALTGLLFGVSIFFNINILPWILISIFLTGIIDSARLQLNQHNHLQIYAGNLIGFTVAFLISYIII